ncbi:MAG: 30S ribosomal protein S20 [Chloroflexi bacterium]|nr:30S ribosomal protein S20 [Chloroflexota bacterium]MBI3734400.1 30S ribosomal protein S20 [Chloroflexota bacterium]
MANTSSAIKRVRSSARKRQRNLLVRSSVRTALKSARQAADAGGDGSAQAVKRAVSEIDRAVSKGMMHKNNAARRKARLMKRLNNRAAV